MDQSLQESHKERNNCACLHHRFSLERSINSRMFHMPDGEGGRILVRKTFASLLSSWGEIRKVIANKYFSVKLFAFSFSDALTWGVLFYSQLC